MARQRFSTIFGQVVCKLRRDQGLSQEALAERAQIHPTHLSRIERGKRVPSLEVAWRLSASLDVAIDEIMRRTSRAFRRGRS